MCVCVCAGVCVCVCAGVGKRSAFLVILKSSCYQQIHRSDPEFGTMLLRYHNLIPVDGHNDGICQLHE